MIDEQYKICKRCIMDTTDPDIKFDEQGFCNHCTSALRRLHEYWSNLEKPEIVKSIVDNIKRTGKNRSYDCVVGVSGGLDSSYLLYKAVEYGLRPLAFHVDNGWNSELSSINIENLVKKLGVDLETLVIDWNSFRAMQRAYFKSSVVDLEMLSDNSISVGLYRVMKKHRIQFSLTGYNLSSETIMPASWLYQPKYDGLNIRSIYKANRDHKKRIYYDTVRYMGYLGIQRNAQKGVCVPLLNYIDYSKEEALEKLKDEIDYRPYPYKHFESRITAFYQGFILPEKYGIDKRRAHLSSMICSGQMTREEALEEVKKPPMSPESVAEEKQYFLKKLGFSENEFHEIMLASRKEHLEFKSYRNDWRLANKIVQVVTKYI